MQFSVSPVEVSMGVLQYGKTITSEDIWSQNDLIERNHVSMCNFMCFFFFLAEAQMNVKLSEKTPFMSFFPSSKSSVLFTSKRSDHTECIIKIFVHLWQVHASAQMETHELGLKTMFHYSWTLFVIKRMWGGGCKTSARDGKLDFGNSLQCILMNLHLFTSTCQTARGKRERETEKDMMGLEIEREGKMLMFSS